MTNKKASAPKTTAKKAYPLRINAQVLAAMQRWADDELRSVNAQIEFVLREALVKSSRVKLVEKTVIEVVENEEQDDDRPDDDS
jgi:hypothetical protein